MHRLNSFACRSSSFASPLTIFASQKRTASVAQASALIANPPRRFGWQEVVRDDNLNAERGQQEGRLLQHVQRRLRAAPVLQAPAVAGASASCGAGVRAQPGGVLSFSHAASFGLRHLVIQAVKRCFVSMEAPMDQTQLPLKGLYCRIDAPSVVPPQRVAACKTYREAVQLCWELRKVRSMTRTRLAELTGLYPPHITCYLNDDVPEKRKRDLPGWAVKAFQLACNNTAISQWHNLGAQLTIHEEAIAERVAA